ncbi:amidohydrolase family protein [Pedobacter sp. HMF7647]|uniref:Amidohydrolase family protein n=1 Tax=Hufsiella arboris TaxID=2695275 RepID=A0A7K1Y5X4_9SPHI|nr:amidohydrolase family protein [Hufsiella arboris]MXV49975.1 amidohydrolase family protein [Hufsiella arboris]
MKKIIVNFLSALLPALAFGQANIVPAKSQTAPVIINGATIHTGNNQVINNGYLILAQGKITAMGEGSAPVTTGAEIINAQGKHVYPGFICPLTDLGLVEFEAVKASVDNEETGDLNTHVRSIVAYNTDSKVIPTVRSNGVLMAQITPEGGLISGQSSVVVLDAWNWQDAAYKTDIAMHVNWPVIAQQRFGQTSGPQFLELQKDRIQKSIDVLNELFSQAKGYSELAKPAVINTRFEAMKGLFDGNKKLFIEANKAKDILQAINFSKKYNVKAVITGGAESYLVADALKDNNIPVILRETQTLPDKEDDDVYLPYKLPGLLQKAGVTYGLTGIGFWRQRNLPFEAGNAVPYGLTKEQALSMITLNNAKILGIDKTTGSLEVGKDATLFISKGDALDMLTLNVEEAFIQGRKINLDNLHKQLYKRYADKYGVKAE